MSTAYIPADSNEFAHHEEGQAYPAVVTSVRKTAKGKMVVFRTANGYAGKSYSGQYAETYARQTCEGFKVSSLDELIGQRAFATFKGSPEFANDLTPALAIELNDADQKFLKCHAGPQVLGEVE